MNDGEMEATVAARKKIESFEDLYVYQESFRLANEVFELTRKPPLLRFHSLCDQMQRAAVSIISNIAEGFERQSRLELVRFLFMAKGSSGELRAQFSFSYEQKLISTEDFESMRVRCKRISAGLMHLIQKLRARRRG